MSDTPRTDAAWNESPVADINPLLVIARTLERENAELREALQEVSRVDDVTMTALNMWQGYAERVEAELAALKVVAAEFLRIADRDTDEANALRAALKAKP
jgi:hypothetical protein